MSNDIGETAGHSATDTATAVQLQGLVLETADMAEFLDNFAKFTAAKLSVGGEVFCGITLARRKKYNTVGSSGPRAQAMDEMQYGFGDGPCLSAIREARTELVSDARGDRRWPEYLATAFEHGVRSILAVPFQLDQEEAKAALNLYAAKENAFSAETVDTAESYVHIAAGSLQLAVRIARLSDARQNLMAAMESRTAIDTAVGVIMAQNRCSQEVAFATLKRASSSRNMKLRDIAVSILASVARDPSVATHFES